MDAFEEYKQKVMDYVNENKENISKMSTLNPVTNAAMGVSNFGAVVNATPKDGGFHMGNLIGTLIFFYAMYLAIVKCKINGAVDPLQLIAAYCCSPCYVVYRLIKPCGSI
jgi:hypothetical protein